MALIKKLLLGLFLCSVGILSAQKGISYQGVVLYPSVELPGIDSKVTPYSEKDVCFRFSIYDDANVLEYSETHTTTTDYYGQVNLIIGRGDNPSIPGRLEVLKWDGTAKFLKVELDYAASCSSWEEIAYDELNYVPFAFYALNSQASVVSVQGAPPINVTGTVTTTDPVDITFDGGLNDLNDVNLITAPVANDVLVFNGTDWEAGTTDSDVTNEIQIVDVDGTNKTITYTDASGTPQQAVNDLTEVLDINDAADVTISAPPADNDILSYDISLSRWVNKPVRELKTIEVVNETSAYNQNQPLLIGLVNQNPLNSNNPVNSTRFKLPNSADIYLISKNNAQVYVVLQALNSNYDGKIITIVEAQNENPLITTISSSGGQTSYYDTSDPNDNYLFIDIQEIILGGVGGSANRREIKYESVEILWYNGIWTPMR